MFHGGYHGRQERLEYSRRNISFHSDLIANDTIHGVLTVTCRVEHDESHLKIRRILILLNMPYSKYY